MKKVIEKIKDWHRGPYIEPPRDPDIVMMGYHHQPKLARAFDRLVEFWLAHWKFLITTFIAVVALYLTFSK